MSVEWYILTSLSLSLSLALSLSLSLSLAPFVSTLILRDSGLVPVPCPPMGGVPPSSVRIMPWYCSFQAEPCGTVGCEVHVIISQVPILAAIHLPFPHVLTMFNCLVAFPSSDSFLNSQAAENSNVTEHPIS